MTRIEVEANGHSCHRNSRSRGKMRLGTPIRDAGNRGPVERQLKLKIHIGYQVGQVQCRQIVLVIGKTKRRSDPASEITGPVNIRIKAVQAVGAKRGKMNGLVTQTA